MTPYLDSLKDTYRESHARLMRGMPEVMEEHIEVEEPYVEPSPIVPRIPVKVIIAKVAAAHHIRVNDITGPRRPDQFVVARAHAAHLISRLRPDVSVTSIGRALSRHHTTIMHSIKNIWPRYADKLGDLVSFEGHD